MKKRKRQRDPIFGGDRSVKGGPKRWLRRSKLRRDWRRNVSSAPEGRL